MTDQAFQDRLSRINKGQQWAPEGVLMPTQTLKQRQRKASMLGNAGYPFSIVLAFGLGMLTVVIARWARFQLFAGGDAGGDILMDNLIIDAAMSSGLAFVIRMMTNLTSPIHLSAKSFGITACVLTMHMAVHRFPDLWAVLFSPDWVKTVISQTEANGILFFTFGS